MPPETPELVVRQHERYRCAVSAELVVASGSERAVRLSASARGTTGSVAATLADCSRGGLGLVTKAYFPPTCLVVVRVRDGQEPVLEFTVRVQRVRMQDRSPTYYVGAAFEEDGAGHAERVAEFLRRHARPMEGGRA